jgi:hypothetical protein
MECLLISDKLEQLGRLLVWVDEDDEVQKLQQGCGADVIIIGRWSHYISVASPIGDSHISRHTEERAYFQGNVWMYRKWLCASRVSCSN